MFPDTNNTTPRARTPSFECPDDLALMDFDALGLCACRRATLLAPTRTDSRLSTNSLRADLAAIDFDPEYLAACGEFLDFAPVVDAGAAQHESWRDDVPRLSSPPAADFLGDLIGSLGPLQIPVPQRRPASPTTSVTSSATSAYRKARDGPTCNNKLVLDARWPPAWIAMELKAFNTFLREGDHGLRAADVAELKQARRRAKSRVYSGRHREAERERRRGAARDTFGAMLDD